MEFLLLFTTIVSLAWAARRARRPGNPNPRRPGFGADIAALLLTLTIVLFWYLATGNLFLLLLTLLVGIDTILATLETRAHHAHRLVGRIHWRLCREVVAYVVTVSILGLILNVCLETNGGLFLAVALVAFPVLALAIQKIVDLVQKLRRCREVALRRQVR